MANPLALQLGQGVAGDQPSHAEATDGQWVLALALGDRPHDALDRDFGVVEDGGGAVGEAQKYDVEAGLAQRGDERVLAVLQAVVQIVDLGPAGGEAVGDDDRTLEHLLTG
ncbi:hypothetical protein OG206_31900 [Streptomyces sp. NBC_01341]|uniref:hypothetical protein n=1 Tax=Streptomyces sp. NBC_01341 TaxID=2903831 RepID=UPI002E123463|nr:hypothetical protein OG206_31900 [Streptomyces sp. NBC_01341]